MLTYESLIEQAKSRGMPHTKIRGILREYLQVLILKELNKTKSDRKLYFTGGTYLRLVHNLKRFSEDLDFNAGAVTEKRFAGLLEETKTGLSRLGIKSKMEFDHWDNIFAAKLIFPEIEKQYNVVSPYSKKEGIIIKIETNKPKWKIKTVTEMVSGFGELYPCICTDIGALFADKIDALTKKNRGRHLYDIIFMLANKYPIDKKVLRILGISKNPLEVVSQRVKDFTTTELKRQAEALRPFLFEESEANLIINAHDIIPSLITKYKA